MKKRTRSVPIFNKILVTVGLLMVVEISLLIVFLFGSGMLDELNKNSADMLHEKVLNRAGYLQHEMVGRWTNLSLAAEIINEHTQSWISDGRLSLTDFNPNSAICGQLLETFSDPLIILLRNNAVTGAYVVLGASGLDADNPEDKTGLYLRDLDPLSHSSSGNQDILLVRAPVSVVRALNISTDTFWQPMYRFSETGYRDFFYKPFYNASSGISKGVPATDLGYWGTSFEPGGDGKNAITYSIPLILEDGTVYGVLGIDMVDSYLIKLLPHTELADDNSGSYALLYRNAADEPYEVVFSNGMAFKDHINSNVRVTLDPQDFNLYSFATDDASTNTLGACLKLNIYNIESMYSGEEWALAGMMPENNLYALSRSIRLSFMLLVMIIGMTGLAGCYVAGTMISRPIVSLKKNLEESNPMTSLHFDHTGIDEVDSLLDSIESLNSEIVTASVRFSTIMEMASIKLAGFELNLADHSIFVTGRFFDIMGMPHLNPKKISITDFKQEMESLSKYLVSSDYEGDKLLYKIPVQNSDSYVMLNYIQKGSRYIGLIEDVTKTVLEKEQIEHERDHDVLTTLKNRRAFQRIMDDLFRAGPETLKTAALLMIDLDNLKHLNDTYGHDCGDHYIKCAAKCFLENTPGDDLVTRVSGDEFYIFYYGYDSRSQIEALIARLQDATSEYSISLPGNKVALLNVSGGIAWYPDDSDNLQDLLKYSDFTMYCVKRTGKGRFISFTREIYENERELIENKAELIEITEKGNVFYSMQPIVDAGTGDVFAYEALMRSDLPTLRSPDKILELARLESQLNRIEDLTWFKALGTYADYVENGLIRRGTKIFVNSIANQCMSPDRMEKFESLYNDYLSDIVLEVTEHEPKEKINHQYKIDRVLRFWGGEVALDDYGTGYNSDTALLNLNPKYIKVDLSIIRDIDTSSDKKAVLKNIVSYAHERGMKIIAEGIETESELETVVLMGADYLQGYFLGKPRRIPELMSEEIKDLLKRMK